MGAGSLFDLFILKDPNVSCGKVSSVVQNTLFNDSISISGFL